MKNNLEAFKNKRMGTQSCNAKYYFKLNMENINFRVYIMHKKNQWRSFMISDFMKETFEESEELIYSDLIYLHNIFWKAWKN